MDEYLVFWEQELDRPIYLVRVAHAQLLRPLEIRTAQELPLH
ncbi:MAG: hypothetical protein KTR21_12795 [Rhodobacteraceae bacterium]|nr:hypothetical protein [Paracoccaceae bacterium]